MSAAGERSIEELQANVLELRRSFDESFSRERAADFEELEDVLLVRIGEVPYAVLRSDVAALVTDRPVTKLLRPRRRGAGLVGIKGRMLAAFELAELLGHEPPPRPARWMLLAGEPPVAFGVSLLEGHEKVERSLFRALDEHHMDGRFCDRVLFMGSEARRVVRLPLVLEWLGAPPRKNDQMMESWTFGRKMAIGFAALVALLLFVSAIAIHSLETTISKKDRVIEVAMENLVTAERLSGMMDQKAALSRGYLLTQNNDFLKQLEEARAVAAALLTRLRSVVLEAEGRALIDRIESADSLHRAANDKSIHDRQNGVPLAEVVADLERDTVPRRVALRRAIDDFVQHQRALLDEAQADAAQQADLASQAVIGGAASGVLLALVVAWTLTRHLTAQIGTAISHVQSSASELETAANQQVSGAREQASAMSEITTTISELLATSRQIAESAQRVARIAGDTASSARSGGEKLNTTERAMGEIQKQVESVVLHMLDLGKRSQEVGVILDIINELSEQTNILSINATIEAVGAGESGRRFVAVADEIRKLADRVGSSTREIRALVEKMRSAVNSTVMAIEGGTKAVESGAKQVSEVTSAFGEIVGQVGLTTEAAREIELSTKQQATAVEQVNVAIASVAQASKETETSSSQTLQTASELSSLSVDLMRLIRSSASR